MKLSHKTKPNFDLDRILANRVTYLTGNLNEGKSMTVYQLVRQIRENYKAPVYTFKLDEDIVTGLGCIPFYNVHAIERIENAFIVYDEAGELFQLNNRKADHVEGIESTFRMLAHNNTIMIGSGLPFDFNKNFSSKASCFGLKSVDKTALVNRSKFAEVANRYQGPGAGRSFLKIAKDKVLFHDEQGFWFENVPYEDAFDTKARNKVNLLEKR